MTEDPDRPHPQQRPVRSVRYFLVDTPEGMAERIRRYVGDAPVETVYLWASVGGMPEDVVLENVRTLCTRLAPLLSDDSAAAPRGGI